MATPLLLTLAAVCGLLLLQGMLGRGAIYQYPFLAGATFGGYVLPQLIGLSNDRFLPPGSVSATLVMASLCAAMCWVGAAAAGKPVHRSYPDYDERRLLIVSTFLSLIGAYFFYAISRLPPEMFQGTQWTGLPVAYLFFARVMTYGFALAVLLYARTRSRLALALVIYGTMFYLNGIIIGGRRQDLVEFSMIFLMAWWFQRDRCLPRPLMLAGVVLGVLFVNSTGEYRTATGAKEGPKWDEVANIDFVGNIERLTAHGGPELTNAAYNIAAVDRSMKFDLGVYHWNALVFSYVPAQIVGADLKHILYLPLAMPAREEFFYSPVTGSTATGLSDAFQSFWYFGCLKFFLIAFVMQKLWWAARSGSITAQLCYMLMPVQALQAITHTTHYFVAPWVHIAIFLLPALMFARRRGRERQSVQRQSVQRPAENRRPLHAGANKFASMPRG
jgi:hypothetical protein